MRIGLLDGKLFLWVLFFLAVGVELRGSKPEAHYCFGDICNENGADQYCDAAFKFCRRCADIQDECFTIRHVQNCTAFCYDLHYRREKEKERVAGCRLPTPPANGKFETTLSLLAHNTTLRSSCDRGYRLSGSPQLQCGDYGIWLGTAPECIEITCPSLPEIFHGIWHMSVQNSTHSPGTTGSVHCEHGFRFHGDPDRTCTLDGKWTPHTQYLACIPDEVHLTTITTALTITIPTVAVSFIALCIVVLIRKRRKKKRQRRRSSTKPDPEETIMLQDAPDSTGSEASSIISCSRSPGRSVSLGDIIPHQLSEGQSRGIREARSATNLPTPNVVNVKVNVAIHNTTKSDSGINLRGSANSSGSCVSHGDKYPIQETGGNALLNENSTNIQPVVQ